MEWFSPTKPELSGNKRDCGKCFGFCMYFPIGIMVQEPIDDEINEGIGKAQLEILSDLDQMKISCYYNSADNGDGYTRILEDVQVLPEVAQEFGWNSLTIKSGTYVIDYSSNPYGDFIVNIEHN
ncbi:MAG: hypothetical protein MZV63_26585 [Marinilabiliales bacterium]|nr:hypothetical protein [Marinilabiliales bacterium]